LQKALLQEVYSLFNYAANTIGLIFDLVKKLSTPLNSFFPVKSSLPIALALHERAPHKYVH